MATSKALAATWFHKEVGQFVLIALVLLHLAAVFYCLMHKKDNLIGPMVRGDKQVGRDVPSSRDDARSRWPALVLFRSCAGLVALMLNVAA